jgi:hypothetical protein
MLENDKVVKKANQSLLFRYIYNNNKLFINTWTVSFWNKLHIIYSSAKKTNQFKIL